MRRILAGALLALTVTSCSTERGGGGVSAETSHSPVVSTVATTPATTTPTPTVATTRPSLRPSPSATPTPTKAPRATRSKSTPKPPVVSQPSSRRTMWNRLAFCESTNRWHYNGSSGFDGGLQFHPDTWTEYKLPGYPRYAWQATPEQQIATAELVLDAQGWGAWPACSRKLGYR